MLYKLNHDITVYKKCGLIPIDYNRLILLEEDKYQIVRCPWPDLPFYPLIGHMTKNVDKDCAILEMIIPKYSLVVRCNNYYPSFDLETNDFKEVFDERCNRAIPVAAYTLSGDRLYGVNRLYSINGNGINNTVYEIGVECRLNKFNNNPNKYCTNGIHFFRTFDEAVRYYF